MDIGTRRPDENQKPGFTGNLELPSSNKESRFSGGRLPRTKTPTKRKNTQAGTPRQSPKSTNDIKVPKRKRARKGKGENEEPGIMRDLRTALRWMRNNQQLFRGRVTEPSVLQMDEEERADALKTALESDYPEAKDPFLFIFQLRQDMDAFVDACADQQGLQISCMFLETVA